jgi:HK97 family phage portal protein
MNIQEELNIEKQLNNLPDYVVKPLPYEYNLYSNNVIDTDKLAGKVDKNLVALQQAMGATGAWRDLGTVNYSRVAEFETAYQRADALRRASYQHSWTRATVMTVARSAVGSGFSIVRHPVFGNVTAENQANKIGDISEIENIYNFFYAPATSGRHIQDYYTTASKIMYTISSLVFYGQAAWEIIYDRNGQPIGFDPLPGFVFPNVDTEGKFQSPAYYYRPWNSTKVYEYKRPRDIFYVTWPGTDLSIFGSSEYIAAAETSIPSDIYAAAVYRSHFENINAPFNGFWQISPNTSDEDYKRFVSMIINRYTGVKNFGRNPIVIRGDAEFKEMRSRSNDDAPYLEGRKYNQEEISALSGVSSSKLGLGSNVNRTNFREQRRDFWETTLRPVYAILEEAIYGQVFVKLFNKKEWSLSFNRPDLTTALEDATIYTRYLQNGIMNANEIRSKINLPTRSDEDGWTYYQPAQVHLQTGLDEYGGSKEESSRERDNTSGTTDRSGEMQRPSSSDRVSNDDSSKSYAVDLAILSEIKTWKKFALKACDGKRAYRKFETVYLDKDIAEIIEQHIVENMGDKDFIRGFFDEILEELNNIILD